MKEVGQLFTAVARHPGQTDATLREGPSSSFREALTELPKAKTTLGEAVAVVEPEPVRAPRPGGSCSRVHWSRSARWRCSSSRDARASRASPPAPAPARDAPPVIADAAIAREVEPQPARATFVEINHVPVQPAQVTRADYAAYLATMPSSARAASIPLRDWSADRPDAPVAWVTFEQAQRYCSSLGGKLLTRERWLTASAGGWSIAGGPLREWTSSTTFDGLVFVMGAHATMTAAERASAIAMPLEKDTEQSARADRRPERIASATIGIRCTR